jgi:hypothetical protein
VLTLSLILISSVALTSASPAEVTVVGHFTEVEGRVDLLRKGTLPVIPVKAQDQVEAGDVVRTKAASRAQVKFVDGSVLTIAPESRVAVEEYLYDGSKGQRQAVLEVFRGLVDAVVTRVSKVEQPDFVIKTHTGVMGIRGSAAMAHLVPQATHFYMESGKSQVSNRWAEVPGRVDLGPMQTSVVGRGTPPTLPMGFHKEDVAHLKNNLAPQASRRGTGPGGGPADQSKGRQDTSGSGSQGTSGSSSTSTGESSQSTSGSTGTGGGGQSASGLTTTVSEVSGTQSTSGSSSGTGTLITSLGSTTVGVVTGGLSTNNVGGVYVPPTTNTQLPVNTTTVTPVTTTVETPTTPTPTPTPYTYTIDRTLSGAYTLSTDPNSGKTASFTGSLPLTNSVVNYTVQATDPTSPGGFNKTGYSGTVNWQITGSLTGTSATGQVSGTVTATGTTSGGTVLTLNVPLTATYDTTTNKPKNSTIGSVTGAYTVVNPNTPGSDYKSPGKSDKVSNGTATATVTKTAK